MNGDLRPFFRLRTSFEESENEVLVHLLDFHWLDMLDMADFVELNVLEHVKTTKYMATEHN